MNDEPTALTVDTAPCMIASPSADDLGAQLAALDEDGLVLIPNAVDAALIESLCAALPQHQRRSQDIRLRNGVPSHLDGSAHHVLGMHDAFHDFLDLDQADKLLNAYFDGPFILNSYGAIANQPQGAAAYQHGSRFHRDVRTYSHPFRLMINMLVMLDEFTQDNGATKLVPGSHKRPQRPTDDELEARAVRALGPAGSILLFDSNVWHSAAPNMAGTPRRALTLTFTRPFMKQQLDYPRLLGEDFTQAPRLRQILGYNARVPVSLDEWFQPPEQRKYKANQG